MRTPEGYRLRREPILGSGGSVEGHLDEGRVRDHGIEVLAVAGGFDDVVHYRPPLIRILDDPSRGGKVRLRTPLDMEREPRVRIKVGEPAPPFRARRPADVDTPVDDVVDDLDAAGLPALPSGGGDIDHIPVREDSLHRVRNRCHDNYHTPEWARTRRSARARPAECGSLGARVGSDALAHV